jgi:hypothetical protein
MAENRGGPERHPPQPELRELLADLVQELIEALRIEYGDPWRGPPARRAGRAGGRRRPRGPMRTGARRAGRGPGARRPGRLGPPLGRPGPPESTEPPPGRPARLRLPSREDADLRPIPDDQ